MQNNVVEKPLVVCQNATHVKVQILKMTVATVGKSKTTLDKANKGESGRWYSK